MAVKLTQLFRCSFTVTSSILSGAPYSLVTSHDPFSYLEIPLDKELVTSCFVVTRMKPVELILVVTVIRGIGYAFLSSKILVFFQMVYLLLEANKEHLSYPCIVPVH